MTCAEAKPLLSAFIDGELDSTSSREIESHVESCPSCLNEVNQLHVLSQSLAGRPIIYDAPPGLEGRVRRAILRQAGLGIQRYPVTPRTLAFAFIAALFLAVVGTWWITAQYYGLSRTDLLHLEILQSHVRSLMPEHLIDVASSDQHTVKPWFDGKVDFSPAVPDLSSQGFSLIGGRLDYVGQKAVSVIVYKRRLHIINLFSWPTPGEQDEASSTLSLRGYQIEWWRSAGMTYYAVSDVNESDLAEFVGGIQQSLR